MSVFTIAFAQVLLTCDAPGAQPLRFGYPLPEKELRRGLRVDGPPGVGLQWRRLQRRALRDSGRVWVELCIAGGAATGSARVRILAGGAGPTESDAGHLVRRAVEVVEREGRRLETTRRHWRGGVVDEMQHVTFLAAQEFEGEKFGAGESVTRGALPQRFLRAGLGPARWRAAGVLPRGGSLGREFRRRLLELAPRMVELRSLRDRGDYRRSKEVMTNLEFDTTLAFARLGLAEGKPGLLERAQRSALHTLDRDLDPRTSLLHRHGKGHTSGPPDPGHTWLTGLLLVGCLTADDRLIDAARRIARGLARHPAMGEGRDDRVRDSGWPLLEMEAWLRFEDDAEVAAAVRGIVRGLRRRFDARHRLLRFGEGKRGRGVYEEPLWVSAGCLLPGLRAHAARTKDRDVVRIVRAMQRSLSDLILVGRPGLPVRAWFGNGKAFRQVRVQGSPSGFMVLEGLDLRDLRRCLRRRAVQSALREVPAFDDPDLPTSFSIVGRCSWIYR